MIKDTRCLEKLSTIMPRIALEPTNICNANCCFCGYRYMKRRKGVMRLDLYQLIIDEMVSLDCKELKFTPIVGDPLCDRSITKKIEYASLKNKFSTIYMYTNLINLHLFDIEHFVNSGITEVVVSTCIADKDMYRRVFGIDAYDHVIRNIKKLLVINDKYNCPINISLTLRNEKPVQKALDSPEYRELINLGANISFMWDQYDNWLGLIKIDNLPQGNTFREVKSIKAPCSQLYSGLIIGFNGKMSICWCRDIDMELFVGQYPDNSIQETWEGSALRELRENWKNGKIPKICLECLQYTSVYEHALLIDTYNRMLHS